MHKHQAIKTIATCWSHCVDPKRCNHDAAHGNITRTEHCKCGATRQIESNGRFATMNRWSKAS